MIGIRSPKLKVAGGRGMDLSIIVLALAAALFGASPLGCSSGMSAPPVSLPTPVTGRIVVSAPDADGNVSVAGEDGAVEAGSTVMVINSSVAGSAGRWLRQILGLVEGTAYAGGDGYPPVCSEEGHACATADENGAFSVTIPAAEEDEIIVVLIDATTGAEISDRLIKEVVGNIFPFFAGLPVDVAVDPYASGEVFVLIKGGLDEEGNLINNRIVRFDPATKEKTTIDVGGIVALNLGLDAADIAVINYGIGGKEVYIAAFDEYGEFTSDDFSSVPLFGGAPEFIIDDLWGSLLLFTSDSQFLLVAGRNSTYSVAGIDLTTPMPEATYLDSAWPGTGYTHVSTDAIARGSYTATIQNEEITYSLVAALARYSSTTSDGSVETATFLGIFSECDLISLLSGETEDISPIGGPVQLPNGTKAVDISFVGSGGQIAVTDVENDAVYVYQLSVAEAYQGDISYKQYSNVPPDDNTKDNNDADNPEDNNPDYSLNPEYPLFDLGLAQSITQNDYTYMINPLEIEAVNISGYGDIMFVTANNGDEEKPDTVMTLTADSDGVWSVQKMMPVGLAPTGLAYDTTHDYLYISSMLSISVTRLGLEELLP